MFPRWREIERCTTEVCPCSKRAQRPSVLAARVATGSPWDQHLFLGLAAKGCAPAQLGEATTAQTSWPEIVFCSWNAAVCARWAVLAGDDLVCHWHVSVETHKPPQGGARCAGPGRACLPWVQHPPQGPCVSLRLQLLLLTRVSMCSRVDQLLWNPNGHQTGFIQVQWTVIFREAGPQDCRRTSVLAAFRFNFRTLVYMAVSSCCRASFSSLVACCCLCYLPTSREQFSCEGLHVKPKS